MDWNNWLRILRWRALEEGDADGVLLSEDRRREATARSRAGLTSEDVQDALLNAREEAFLAKRSDWLEHEVIGWSGSVVRLMERLTVAQGRWSWALVGWLAALVAGYSVSGLGQEAEFNLLALPLVAVLLWNAVIMLVAVLMEFWPTAKTNRGDGGLVAWLEKRLTTSARENVREGDSPTGITVDQRFSFLAGPLAAERLCRRFRAWLHIAAALLAFGSAIGLYARGWSREYRAVWESTLLSETQAQTFFSTLFSPASRLLGVAVPIENVPRMQRTGGVAAAPAPALPWIHLYAGTLLLLVVVPRLALAGFTIFRGRLLLGQRARALGWRPYLVRTLRAVEGGHEKITVLVHGTDATPTHLDMWTRGVRERFGALVDPEMTPVSLGDEDDFVAAWTASTARVIVVFNLATTPEAEVQRRFMADVRQALLARQRDAELVVLLDATSIGNRWSPEKFAGRERLWSEMMQGVADEVIIASRKADAPPRLPA